jgi:hypothetical protein
MQILLKVLQYNIQQSGSPLYPSTSIIHMKTKIKSILIASKRKLINVQLDYRTFITVSSLSALKMWLVRYPEAKVIR